MKKLFYILFLLPLLAVGQSGDQNYVKTHTYQFERAATDTTATQIGVTYLDGLGRPIQKIAGRANPDGKDIITHVEYDDLGRQPKEYLPYASTTRYNYEFDPAAFANTKSFYSQAKYENNSNPNFSSETFYDNSPLNRTTKQAAPGKPWKANPDTDYNVDNDNDHTIKFKYTLNKTSDNVRYFKVGFGSTTEITNLVPNGYYNARQLYKTITKDENWVPSDNLNKTTEEYTDKHGRMILKRNYNDNQGHDTYYVYDKFSNLTYVIPPLASDQVVRTDYNFDFIGISYPWTSLSRVDQYLADSYQKELEAYDNWEILNLDLINKYGGQGGYIVTPNANGGITLTLNVTTTQPMPLKLGEIADLSSLGSFPNKEQGKISGPGFEYYFVISDNILKVDGYGDVPSIYLNTTLTGETPLAYSKNYPWTKVCKADAMVAANYEKDIQSLDNSEILTTYTANPYGASGGLAVSLDSEDNITLSFNIHSDTALELYSGDVFPLDIERSLPDAILGTIVGDGFEYEFSIYNNSLHVKGQGFFNNLNFNSTRRIRRNEYIRDEIVDGLCYIYNYDYRNRLVKKKIPGKGWEHIVYDKIDRVVLTQDQNLRNASKWLFTKYDYLNRPAYTGEYIDTRDRVALQAFYNGLETIENETRYVNGQEVYINGGMTVGYSNKVHPRFSNVAPNNIITDPPTPTNTDTTLYTVAYYDNTTDVDMNGITAPSVVFSKNVTTETKGLPMATKTRVLQTNDWIVTGMAYDSKGRVIWTHSKDAYLDSEDILTSKLDFLGRPTLTTTIHKKIGLPDLQVNNEFKYDMRNGMPTSHIQAIGTLLVEHMPPFTTRIAKNAYDELNQLEGKEVGGSGYGNPLQNIGYRYNIRGWLTDINDIDNMSRNIFSFRINYDAFQIPGSTALFNGNISETHWAAKDINGNSKKRSYKYQYDALNRLTAANYHKGYGYTLQDNPTQLEDYTEGSILYDKNGNLIKLKRYGLITATNGTHTIGIIDDLTYQCEANSNRLKKVTDASNKPEGFDNGTTVLADDYAYDSNGNMKMDKNKGIGNVFAQEIKYNHLNLPKNLTVDNGTIASGSIQYIYDATGAKLEKRVTEGGITTVTQYDHGFIYKKVGTGVNTLEFFPHSEGYAEAPLPTIKDEETGEKWYSPNGFKYIYQYKDHLGNVRLSYTDANKDGSIDPTSGEIFQEDNYYAFGLKHEGYNSVLPFVNEVAQNYKYNGKELQGELKLDWYDYQARNYDPALGRWFNIDPLAEKSRRFSPYAYCLNNPVFFIDPDGMEATESNIDMEAKLDGGDEKFIKNGERPMRHTSTVVDSKGKIIDHKDDGDKNIYLNKRGGTVVGTERDGVKYKEGENITQADLSKDYKLKKDGYIHDISRLNKEKKAGKKSDAQIKNCPVCNSRRCNGSSHTSTSRAIEKGVEGMTTTGSLATGAAAWGVEGFTVVGGIWGLFSAFVPGYLDDVKLQYNEYNDKLQETKAKQGSN